MEHPINILERYWNYTAFKPQQEAIIQSVLDGEDTLALLPTGGGKSMCYQIPALLKDGICISAQHAAGLTGLLRRVEQQLFSV